MMTRFGWAMGVAALALGSVQVLACPELTGRYECRMHQGTQILNISQELGNDGFHRYRIETEGAPELVRNVTTDDQWRPVPPVSSPMLQNARRRAACGDDGSLLVEVEGERNGNLTNSKHWIYSDATGGLRNLIQTTIENVVGPKSESFCGRL